MLTMGYFNHISIYENDTDSLAFKIDNYKFEDKMDEVEMFIRLKKEYNDSPNQIFVRILVHQFVDGIAFLKFNKDNITSMPVGEYEYQIKVKLGRYNHESVQLAGDLTVKETYRY